MRPTVIGAPLATAPLAAAALGAEAGDPQESVRTMHERRSAGRGRRLAVRGRHLVVRRDGYGIRALSHRRIGWFAVA
jgi:hypothetical protein